MKSLFASAELNQYFRTLSALYRDVARAYPARNQIECARDLQTVSERINKEGLSFLTKTLPSLAKAIDTALASDTPLRVPAFAKKRGSNLPIFMGWLLGCIFDTDGSALPAKESAGLALKHARQLLYLFYKLELPIDQRSVVKTIDSFKATDLALEKAWDLDLQQRRAVKQARALIMRVLCNADPRKIIPKHGPGAVSTGEKPWEKSTFKRIYPELDRTYPYTDHMFFNYSHLCDELGPRGLAGLEIASEPPTAKVVLVPKDSRGPRLISMEPLEIQWIQQGLKTLLVDTIEEHPLTSRHVNFADQEVNRQLALSSSRDGLKVTLDMKDASDRVSQQLVHTLFPLNWVECMESCRSTRTLCPNGDTVQLNKFAPMGSALCFPVEALCFWALSCAALMVYKSYDIRQAAERIWVYGDDIVLHTEDYRVCMQLLESVGLMFNQSKCCTGAHFRESCGLDAYNGVVVTPLRFKRRWVPSLPVQTWASWVDYVNRFRELGYYETADLLEKDIQKTRRTPYTNDVPVGIMFRSLHHTDARKLNLLAGIRYRFNRRYQCMEVQTTYARSVSRTAPKGWRELLAYTTRKGLREHRDQPPSFRKGIRLSSDLIDQSLGISVGVGAGQYSAPHRVSSKCGWTRAA